MFKEENGMRIYGYVVGGVWRFREEKEEVKNPYDDAVFANICMTSKEDVDKAISKAQIGLEKNRDRDILERKEMLMKAKEELEKNREEIVEMLMKEAGKPRAYAEGEMNAVIERFEYLDRDIEALNMKVKKHGNKISIQIYEPVGIVLAIAPFNYPLLTMLNKILPALIAGNSIIAKPSTTTPISTMYLADALIKVGFKEEISFLVGKGREIGDALIEDERINMISFTGSTAVGRRIAEKSKIRKLHLELGGKGTAFVMDDLTLSLYAKEIASGAFKFTGQRCDAISRAVVYEDIKDKLLQALVREAEKYKYGEQNNRDTKLGPLISTSAWDKANSLLEDALSKGARLVLEGKRERESRIFEPVILDGVTESMDIFWEEAFAPILSIIDVKTEEEAIQIIKKNKYGLDGAIFSKDVEKALKIAREFGDGSVTINAHPTHGIGIFPFGGNKDSGMGREGIGFSAREMSNIKNIVVNLEY